MRSQVKSMSCAASLALACTVLTHAKEPAAEYAWHGIANTQPANQRSVAIEQGFMVPYTEQIPGTDITFEMLPIPGGDFLLGSPADEIGRSVDEGPQVRIQLPPCWVGRCEVSWAEYQAYMDTYSLLKNLHRLRVEMRRFGANSKKLKALPQVKKFLESESLDIDGVTAPTPLYEPDVTYAAGQQPNQPAVTMSQFAAKQYTKWLSGITDREYRLPTEAEWEYAARAGSQTPYSFAAGESLNDYAWYAANSAEQLHAVGSKQPNAWGLYDMHGNVGEWVLDEYDAQHYNRVKGGKSGISAHEAVKWPQQLYPRVIRGGCWFDKPAACRSAARRQSDDPEWTLSDPNLPTSPWWFTEEPAQGVGFRILRPLVAMDKALKKRVWDADIEAIRQDVADRLKEGRGTQSGTNTGLLPALKELESAGLID